MFYAFKGFTDYPLKITDTVHSFPGELILGYRYQNMVHKPPAFTCTMYVFLVDPVVHVDSEMFNFLFRVVLVEHLTTRPPASHLMCTQFIKP